MPIDAAEFEAHQNLSSVITEFLCRNKEKGFSAKEIAQATGISEADVHNSMLKLGFSDVANAIAGRRKNFRIEDVAIGGTIFYRCVSD